MEEKKKTVRSALGRGLSALISQPPVSVIPPTEQEGNAAMQLVDKSDKIVPLKAHSPREASANGVQYVDINKISNNPTQPRTEFKEAELVELAASIKKLGVLQPIVVRNGSNDALEIVAGERRWRASKLAGLKQVPVILKDLSDRDSLEIAIVENVQRENLNPIEQAIAYQRLISDFDLSQDEVADKVSKDRATVSNILRLLKLPKEIQTLIQEGKISLGHAKAILAIKDPNGQLSLAKKVINESLSVRALEGLVSRVVVLDAGKTAKERSNVSGAALDAGLEQTIERLRRTLGTKVLLKHQLSGKGSITIEYFSESELERIIEKICIP